MRVGLDERGHGDHVALVDIRTGDIRAGDALSYEELARRVRRMAAALRADGVGARAIGWRSCRTTPPTTPSRGTAYSTPARSWSTSPHSSALKSSGASSPTPRPLSSWLVTGIDIAESSPPTAVVRRTDVWRTANDERPPVPRLADDPALLAYTSGTTGLPKGVVHTHRAVVAQLDLLRDVCGFGPSSSTYVSTPMFAMHGYLSQVAHTLHVGGTVIIDDKFDARRMAAASRAYDITYTVLSSPMPPRILELPVDERPDFTSTKMVSCGGAPLTPEVREEFETTFDVRLTQGYASTEVLGAFVMDIEGTAPWGAAGAVYPEGVEVVRILDDDGCPVARGVEGEIAFHRDYTTAAYWQRPEETAAAFVGEVWFATGDIGKLSEDGFLFVLDRKTDMIIRGGFNIYSAEIERVLSEHPDVREAVVVGAPHPRLGEVPVAFVVPARPEVRADDLRAYTLERLGKLKGAESVHLVEYDDLPRSAIGKVQKPVLRARLSADAATADGQVQ